MTNIPTNRDCTSCCGGDGRMQPTLPGVPTARLVPEAKGVHRHLDPVLFDRATYRLVSKEGFESNLAAKATDEAFAFVQLAARCGGPGSAFTPTRLVDVAWHAMILFTKDYARLGEKLGQFVHHEPNDHPGDEGDAEEALAATVFAMVKAGISHDPDLWAFAANVDSGSNCCAQCSRCSAGSCRS